MLKWQAETIRYVAIGYVLVPLLINGGINATVAWFQIRGQASIAVWGMPKSLAMEFIGTNFFLPLITAIISSRMVSRHLATKLVEPPLLIANQSLDAVSKESRGLISICIRLMPSGSIGNCLRFSILVSGVLLLPTLLEVFLSNKTSISSTVFILWKTTHACFVGVLVTPIIAIAILSASARNDYLVLSK